MNARLVAPMFALCALAFAPPALAVEDITRPVTDPGGRLEASDSNSIARALVQYREQMQVQIAVLVIGTTRGVPIEDYAHETAVRWGGGPRGQDRGALVVFALDDRRSRIELGYGLEAQITDGDAQLLLDSVRPELRRGDTARAIALVVDGIVREIGGSPTTVRLLEVGRAVPGAPVAQPSSGVNDNGAYANYGTGDYGSGQRGGGEWGLGASLVALIVILVLVIGLVIFAIDAHDRRKKIAAGSDPSWWMDGSSNRRTYSSSSSSYDSSAYVASYTAASSSSYDSSSSYSSSSSSYDSSSSSSNDTSWGGGGGDFGGGGASSSW